MHVVGSRAGAVTCASLGSISYPQRFDHQFAMHTLLIPDVLPDHLLDGGAGAGRSAGRVAGRGTGRARWLVGLAFRFRPDFVTR